MVPTAVDRAMAISCCPDSEEVRARCLKGVDGHIAIVGEKVDWGMETCSYTKVLIEEEDHDEPS